MKTALKLIALYTGLLPLAGCFDKDGLPDLRESYSWRDTKPFGTYAAKEIIEAGLNAEAEVINAPFTQTYALTSDTNAVYVSISRYLYVDDEEAQAMLDYVYLGNTLLLSAADIDSILLSKLLCDLVKADLPGKISVPYTNAKVSLDEKVGAVANAYSYYYKPFANHFSSVRAEYTKAISFNSFDKPNAFILFWGKGRLILHCDPRAFSNYFLLKNNNYEYLQNMLQLTNRSPRALYWDDHYRKQGPVKEKASGNFSTFSELMKYPSLAMALWIFVFLLVAFLLFNSKRKQRVIPVIKPNENSSVAFTETIARLYLQHHDNRNVAGKMIIYFNEYIHKNYFLNANANDSDLISALSRKSGVSFDETKSLFEVIDLVNNSMEVSDQLLLELNEKLQKFYKN